MAHGHVHVRQSVTITSSTGLKLGIALVLYASINVKPRGGGGTGICGALFDSCFLPLMKRQQPRNVWFSRYFPRKKVYLLVSLYLTVLPIYLFCP